jgi:hypothetical protein
MGAQAIFSCSLIPSHIPIKLVSYWRQLCFFLALAVFQYLSIFCGHQYFSHLPSKKGGDTTLLIQGTIPTTTFQSYFLLYSCEIHLSYVYWRRYIGGTTTTTPSVNLESDIELPQYHLIRGVVLGDC